MGTPEFAAPALIALYKNAFNIAMVVTQPDRPKGRGRKFIPSPVKETALSLGITVAQPETVKTRDFINIIKSIRPDFLVVIAFGQILPASLLAIPEFGAINVHASLLPKYRGPAPIQWAIINEEMETGVTTIKMDKGIDTGDIFLTQKTPISIDDNFITLHNRLADMGAAILLKTLTGIEKENIHPVAQDHAQATHAPILKKNDGHINWNNPAHKIDALIRGIAPWPGAFSFHEGKRLKILSAKMIEKDFEDPPGKIINSQADELIVATGKGAISILEIQGESGKPLRIKDFLNGYPLKPGTQLN
jgi:methionyl-tRNA formyltransferase